MTSAATAPKEQIRIFDRRGQQLCQFRATVFRSWVIGAEGRASMTLATRKTSYVNDYMLRPGNWLYVQNDSLPDWIGVIDLPREWGLRTVTINAFTPEHVFSFRRGPLEVVLSGSAGSIFVQLLAMVNGPEATIVQAGGIWGGGPSRQITINPSPLSEALESLQDRSKEEYQWRPVITSGGSLVVYADWLNQLGQQTSVILQEGRGGGNVEASDSPLIEDGPIINDLLGYGQGTTWTTRPNVVTVATDNSRALYGLRQESADWGGAIDEGTLTANNKEVLRQNSQPSRIFGVTALNRGETFRFLRLGNRLKLVMQSSGFIGATQGMTANVRIIGMAYDPSQGHKVQLNLQEVL